jgi:hypothetical protein
MTNYGDPLLNIETEHSAITFPLVLVSANIFAHIFTIAHCVTRMVALTEAHSLQRLGSDGCYPT